MFRNLTDKLDSDVINKRNSCEHWSSELLSWCGYIA